VSIKARSKEFIVRVIRKVAHIGNRALHKALSLSTRVEGKASRILDGSDYSIKVTDTDTLERVYYSNVPFVLPINPALPRVDQTASVVLLIPSLDGKSFYGGAATALVVAAKLALAKKRPLHILQTTKTGHPSELQEFFDREGVRLDVKKSVTISSVADRAYNIYGYLPMHPDDIFIASAWWDAHTLLELPMKHKFIYLIQDFEPIFYNNSDFYVLAEETYKKTNFIPVCNTKLMYDFMKSRNYPAFAEKAFYFEPAVSRQLGDGRREKQGKKNLFLYGRPNVHRNLFFTALNSLDYSFKAGFLNPKEWNIFMAGDDNLPNIKLSSGPVIQNKGKMPMEEYVKFCKTIDVAVSPMMAPHPNYPTLEFASVGAQVVTTRYANKIDLSNYSSNIIMCDIGVESMAGAIREASSRVFKPKKAAAKIMLPPNWDSSLNSVIDSVLREL
jgi:hypothetical protein